MGEGGLFLCSLFSVTVLGILLQAPGTPIIARQVTPTTIIKQVSQAQTTVQPTTTLQRPPVVQVGFFKTGVTLYLSVPKRGQFAGCWGGIRVKAIRVSLVTG